MAASELHSLKMSLINEMITHIKGLLKKGIAEQIDENMQAEITAHNREVNKWANDDKAQADFNKAKRAFEAGEPGAKRPRAQVKRFADTEVDGEVVKWGELDRFWLSFAQHLHYVDSQRGIGGGYFVTEDGAKAIGMTDEYNRLEALEKQAKAKTTAKKTKDPTQMFLNLAEQMGLKLTKEQQKALDAMRGNQE